VARGKVRPLEKISPADISSGTPFVIFGAGNLGRKVARALQGSGGHVVAFCDNNRALWGSAISAAPVMSPAQAVASFPDALFLVAIWHPAMQGGLRHHVEFLRVLGCRRVTTFIPVMWNFPQTFLPNMFWDLPGKLEAASDAVHEARNLLDDAGKAEFERQWKFRIEADPFCLADLEPSPQYFPPDFFQLSSDECFIDCGAFDGDTLAQFLKQTNHRFNRYIAFEPEPTNFSRLETAVASAEELAFRISIYPYAVGARSETLSFSSAGISSIVSAEGDLKVECIALDEVLRDDRPTFIKMDIEGFELEALAGARTCIQRHRPKLAICVYHSPDHLWRVPLALHELLPGSRMTMRSYQVDGFDTVCYCLPD
jgi:FkbM family methyltransferase